MIEYGCKWQDKGENGERVHGDELHDFDLPEIQNQFAKPLESRAPLFSHAEIAAIHDEHQRRLDTEEGQRMLAKLREGATSYVPMHMRGGPSGGPSGESSGEPAAKKSRG